MITAAIASFVALATPPEAVKSQKEYVAKLTAAALTAEAQFKLASWARKVGMPEVADGHLRAAAYLDPKHEAAQTALGRTLKQGRWETKEERRQRAAVEARLRAERDDWERRLVAVGVEQVASERPFGEGGAAAIVDFAAQSQGRALAAVTALRRSEHGAATLALLRLSVASPFERARHAAAEALRERNPDHVLPPLVERARPQPSSRATVAGVGEVWYWQEGTTLFVALPERAPAQRRSSASAAASPGGDVESRHADLARQRANAVEALETVTGMKVGDDFARWREAVSQITGSSVSASLPPPTHLTTTSYQPEVATVGTAITLPMSSPSSHSCFAAGTPVATKRGTVPIDKVCVGELVLSRDVETGETAYKPVLARTLRPRVPMRKLSVGGETLLATAGHPFWTADQGWVKAKHLSGAATLGAEDGAVQLTKIEEAEEPMQAYNLVVADFGTYFVGTSRLLVHDNTPIRDAPAKAR